MSFVSSRNAWFFCLVLTVASCMLASPAGGQEEQEAPEELEPILVEDVGFWSYGPCYAVAVDVERDVAYIGSGGMLLALDVSSLDLPEKIAELRTSGVVHGLALAEERLYVADGHGGLRIIDASNVRSTDEAKPALAEAGFLEDLGQGDALPQALDIVVRSRGDDMIAYVANGEHGLSVISVTDPAAPSFVAGFDTGGRALDVDVTDDGAHAYVADESGGLRILDVSDPNAIAEVGAVETHAVLSVSVGGDVAFVLDEAAMLRSYDTSIPATPGEVDSLDLNAASVAEPLANPGVTPRVLFHPDDDGGKLLVAAGKLGLLVVENVANGSLATENVRAFAVRDSNKSGFASNVAAAPGGYGYLADGYGGMVRLNLVTYEELDRCDDETPGYVSNIALDGELIHLLVENGIRVLTATQPHLPVQVGVLDKEDMLVEAWDPWGLSASGGRVYVADRTKGLRLFTVSVDTTNPPNILALDEFLVPHQINSPSKVAVDGSLACVTDAEGALHVFDVTVDSDAKRLTRLTEVDVADGARLAFSDGTAWVVGSNASLVSGLFAYDLSGLEDSLDPEPTLVKAAGLNLASPRSVVVAGSIAHVADDAGLHVIDLEPDQGELQDGDNAVQKGRLDADGYELATVAVAGTAVYATLRDGSGLQVYNIRTRAQSDADAGGDIDPDDLEIEEIELLSTLRMPLDPGKDVLAVSDNLVYVAVGAAGVRIMGVDREAPRADAGEDKTVLGGWRVVLDGKGSTDDVAVDGYEWTSLDPSLTITNPDSAEASVTMPNVSSPKNYVFALTVTDKTGRRSEPDEVTVTVTPFKARADDGDDDIGPSGCVLGSPGGFGAEWLLLGLGLVALRLRGRRG